DRGVLDGVIGDRPALAAAVGLTRALRAAGIAGEGAPGLGVARPGAAPLAQVVSPPLRTLVRRMNKESDNFSAELLLKELGAVRLARGPPGDGAPGLRP